MPRRRADDDPRGLAVHRSGTKRGKLVSTLRCVARAGATPWRSGSRRAAGPSSPTPGRGLPGCESDACLRAHQLHVRDPVRLVGVRALPALQILHVALVVPLVPLDILSTGARLTPRSAACLPPSLVFAALSSGTRPDRECAITKPIPAPHGPDVLQHVDACRGRDRDTVGELARRQSGHRRPDLFPLRAIGSPLHLDSLADPVRPSAARRLTRPRASARQRRSAIPVRRRAAAAPWAVPSPQPAGTGARATGRSTPRARRRC
jgi:hypothetical protein